MQADVDAGVTCAAVNQCTVERKLMERLLATSALANSARFVPSVKDDKPIGIKLYAIRPSSLFGKVGFQNGDTIEQVNGIDVRGFETLLEAYKSLRAATRITVKLQRRGQPVSLEVLVQ
jgi:general secretion pathway protein C